MAFIYLVPAIYDAALGVFSFALPLFLVDMGVSPLTIGSLLALPAMTQIFLRIPAGMMAGRIGNVRAMLVGCALTTLSAGIIASSPVARVVAFVATAQILSGLGRASFWPANQAHLFDVARDRISSVIGPYNFVVTLGGMSGPLLAGVLMTRAGSASAFWLICAFSVASGGLLVAAQRRQTARVAAAAAVAGVSPDTVETMAPGGTAPSDHRPPSPVAAGPGGPWQSLGRVVRSPAVWLGGLICIASVIPYTVSTSFFQVLMRQRGATAASISLLIAVRSASVALFSLVTSSYVKPAYRARLLLVSGVLGALGLALIPGLAGTPGGVIPMLLLGFCGGAMHNVQMAVSGEATASADRALAMAVVGSVGNVAMTLTPLWHGWMAERGWLEQAFIWTGLVLAVVGAAAWQWTLALYRQRAASSETITASAR